MLCKGAFNCSGKININDWQLNELSIFRQKELETFLNPSVQNHSENYNFHLFGSDSCGYSVITELMHFRKCMDGKLKELLRHEKLNNSTKEDSKYFKSRRLVCEFLTQLRNYIQCLKEEGFSLDEICPKANEEYNNLIQAIYKFMQRLKFIPDAFFFYSMSTFGNKFNKAEYHLYHMHLDLRWLIITLVNVRKMPWVNPDNSEHLENAILMVIHDLIYISIKTFTNITNEDYKNKTPFTCTCVRELWLMIQLLTDETSNGCNKTFWNYVNIVIDNFLSTSLSMKNSYQVNASLPNHKKKDLYSIWLIYHLNLLYSYNENGEYLGKPYSRMKPNILQVENILKFYVNNGGKDGTRDDLDEDLKILIPLVHNLCLEWKESSLNIITLFWECFHRRFDHIQLMQRVGFGLYSTSLEKLTPENILHQVKNRIKHVSDMNNQTSFAIFLNLIGNFSQNKFDQDVKSCNRLQSRIYTSFSKKKVNEYTENGLYNFISLFLTLAITSDALSVTSKMMSLLPTIFDKNEILMNKKCYLSWKAQLVVLLLYNERKFSYEQIASSFIEMLNRICCDKQETSRSMMIAFIDTFEKIISDSKNFDFYQHLFISGWVDRYLLECPINRSSLLLKILANIFEKSNDLPIDDPGSDIIINQLWKSVASRVRQMVLTAIPDTDLNLYRNLTKLAAHFTIDACQNPSRGKNHGHSAEKLFDHLISLMIKETRITQLYLTIILQSNIAVEYLKKKKSDFNEICVRAWLKCAILINDNSSEESKFLLNHLQNLMRTMKIFEPFKMNIVESKEPVFKFLETINCKRLSIKQESDKVNFDINCKKYFQSLEKWLLSTITNENKDSQSSLWIYNCAGNIIYHCSLIFYHQNQPNNLFHALVNKIALPSDENQKFLENLAEKIFSKIILGFENLNFKTDLYSKAIFRQLFERYLPRLINTKIFKISPQIDLIFKESTESFVDYILETFAFNFLITSGNKTTLKIFHLVTFLIKNLLENDEYFGRNICTSIMSKCFTQILNCYFQVHDLHEHKKETINIIKLILKNPSSGESRFRETLNKQVWNCFSKYLSINYQRCFVFACDLFAVDVELYKFIHDQLKIKAQEMNNQNIKYLLERLKNMEKK